VRLEGAGRLERVVLERNRLQGAPFQQSARGTGEIGTIECGILFRSIGYKGVAISEVPFDERNGVMPNRAGRVLDSNGSVVPGLYCAGWIKRGPSGIIGTNRACSVETIGSLLADLDVLATPDPKSGRDGVLALIEQHGLRAVNYDAWLRLDAAEVERGKPKGKPREKFTRLHEMLALLG
jgi:ferredoxin--NADP+ reductase